jgi:ribosomal protein RSM22 (predicted rRNA methylase)
MAARPSKSRLAGLLRRLQALGDQASAVAPPLPHHHQYALAAAFTTGTLGNGRGVASAAAAAAAVPRNERPPRPPPQQQQETAALVRLPSDLVGAVEGFLGSSSAGGARGRQTSMSLGDALKRLSKSNRRSKGAASTAAAPAQSQTSLVRRTRSGRLRARDLAALEDVVAERGADALSEQDLALYVFGERAGGSRGGGRPMAAAATTTSSAARQHQHAQQEASSPVYERADAAAYALARLAPCYAACRAAMNEVAVRLGGGGGADGGRAAVPPPFTPRSMLDYGSGPGTAIWAAQDVWLLGRWMAASDAMAAADTPQQQPLRTVHAVERSAAMTGLGRSLASARLRALTERDARLAEQKGLPSNFPRRPASSSVAWAPSLAALRRRVAGGAGRRRYDLVTCSYALSEVAGGGDEGHAEGVNSDPNHHHHRDRIVRALWDMVAEGGVLLVVEPGTAAGSAAVLRARDLVLDVALRRAAKRDRRELRRQEQQEGEEGEPEGGAYVVAPCPHDGPCPMQAAADAWAARGSAAKARDGDSEDGDGDDDDSDESGAPDDAPLPPVLGASAGTWARAWCHFGQRLQRPAFMRRAAAGASSAARSDHQDERFSYVAIRRGRRPEPLPKGHVLRLVVGEEEGGVGGRGGAATRSPFAAASGERLDEGNGESEEEEEEAERSSVVLDDQLLEAIDEMVAAGPLPLAEDEEADEEDEEDDGGSSSSSSNDLRVPVSVSAGPGLVDRLVSLDAAGVEWWRPEALDELQRVQEDGEDGAPASPPTTRAAAAQHQAPVPAEEAEQDDDAFRLRREAQAAMAAAARSGAAGWARLVRPPLKRGGHVVVDLCCAATGATTAAASSLRRPSPAPAGVLLRATLTRASLARAWAAVGSGGDDQERGAAAYALTRGARWGEVLPLPPQQATGEDD